VGGDATTDVVGGGVTGAAADVYMAASVRAQYKATAVPSGVVRWVATRGGRAGLECGALAGQSRCATGSSPGGVNT